MLPSFGENSKRCQITWLKTFLLQTLHSFRVHLKCYFTGTHSNDRNVFDIFNWPKVDGDDTQCDISIDSDTESFDLDLYTLKSSWVGRMWWRGWAWSRLLWSWQCTCNGELEQWFYFSGEKCCPISSWIWPHQSSWTGCAILFSSFSTLTSKDLPPMSYNGPQLKEANGTVLTISGRTDSQSLKKQDKTIWMCCTCNVGLCKTCIELYHRIYLFWSTIVAKYLINLSQLGHEYRVGQIDLVFYCHVIIVFVGQSTIVLWTFIHISQQIRNWHAVI